jgi:hypothetical protein
MIVFKVSLIVLDTANDILFITKQKNDLVLNGLFVPRYLFPTIFFLLNLIMIFIFVWICSLLFVCFPFFINTCLAFKIFTFEIRGNSKFEVWYKDNSKLAGIITLFSSGNVELLHLLNSKYAGLEIFDAPFSPRALYLILWGGIINMFIEDIPQLLIQVKFFFLKKKNHLNNDTILKLSLSLLDIICHGS